MKKSNKGTKSVDDYIALHPGNVGKILVQMRRTIKESAPGSEEVISYQLPAYKLNGRILVYFAAFKDHISFFPTSAARVFFKKELAEYKGGKGTVQFPLDKPIPFGLVRKIVRHRMKEVNPE